MPMQPLLTMLMLRMPLSNLAQTIPHQKLIISRRKKRSRHINQNSNPAIIQIRKHLAAKENRRNDSTAQVPGQICGNGHVGEAPDHGCVCETDGEGGAGCGDEGVGRVETGPDYDADIGVDEEFGEEEIAKVSWISISRFSS